MIIESFRGRSRKSGRGCEGVGGEGKLLGNAPGRGIEFWLRVGRVDWVMAANVLRTRLAFGSRRARAFVSK